MSKLLYDCPIYGYKAGDEVSMYEIDKGDNNMFDVNNIKIGDILIDWEDRVGYVYDIYLRGDGYIRFHERRIGENVGREYNGGAMLLQRCFKQIGGYKFNENTEDKKSKIKPLTYTEINCIDIYSGKTFADYKDLPKEVEVVQKINEIIDYLNKE